MHPGTANLPTQPDLGNARCFFVGEEHVPGSTLMWAMIDSGCNRHYLPTEEYFLHHEPSSVKVTGIAGHTETAKSQGIWGGTLGDAEGNIFNFSAFGTYLPTSKIALLSVGQITSNGNSVTHIGAPETGQHGMTMVNAVGVPQFIPFTWCPTYQLWWVPIFKNPQAYSMNAGVPVMSTNAECAGYSSYMGYTNNNGAFGHRDPNQS